ncbi:hypothetical protein [Haloplanus salinus]|uniref:hypothetical protein n=1 Tax=Haloplanus salinus TaxID=1126245 RepID=UPI001FE917D3|nr:hypothetical protein [Haloplanus salinus]
MPDESSLSVTFHPDAAREYPGEPKDSHGLFDAEGALERPQTVGRWRIARTEVVESTGI